MKKFLKEVAVSIIELSISGLVVMLLLNLYNSDIQISYRGSVAIAAIYEALTILRNIFNKLNKNEK